MSVIGQCQTSAILLNNQNAKFYNGLIIYNFSLIMDSHDNATFADNTRCPIINTIITELQHPLMTNTSRFISRPYSKGLC